MADARDDEPEHPQHEQQHDRRDDRPPDATHQALWSARGFGGFVGFGSLTLGCFGAGHGKRYDYRTTGTVSTWGSSTDHSNLSISAVESRISS